MNAEIHSLLADSKVAAPRLTGVSTLGATAAADRWELTSYGCDNYGRQSTTITPDPDGAGPLKATKAVQSYDSASRPTYLRTYTTDGSGDTLTGQSQNVYTGLFLTDKRVYSVSGGSAGSYLATHYDYGDYGRLVKTTDPAGAFTKTGYSLGGDALSAYLGTSEGTDTTPGTTADDTIVEQTDYTCDADGSTILTTHYQRNDDATATGPFATNTTQAQVSYRAAWHDDLDPENGTTLTFSDPENGTTLTFSRRRDEPPPRQARNRLIPDAEV